MAEGCLRLPFMDHLSPEMNRLLLWRNPIESGVFMLAGLTILFSLASLSFISVIAYSCLTLLCCTAGWKIYHEIHRSFNKSDPNTNNSAALPFESLLNLDLNISDEKIQNFTKTVISYSSAHIDYIRRVLVLVNYIESAKFALAMYMLTIVGSIFNLLTLITLSFTVAMTWPKIYELYQTQIDQAFGNLRNKILELWKPIKAQLDNLPIIGKKKPE